jgi:hypothetical protein
VKIYVAAAVEALRKKGKRGIKTGRRNSVWHKNGAFLSFTTPFPPEEG